MNLLVLSDLHIDTGDNFGTCQWKETDLIAHIEYIRRQYSIDRVIFNGDTFELFKYRYEEIRKANPLLMQYFSNKDFIFIKGNHDIVVDFGLNNFNITNSSGQVIHIEHGHNADWFDGTRSGRAISKVGFSILKKLSGSRSLMDIYLKVVANSDQINHIPKRYNTIRYLSYALKLLKEYDVVILGHTHKLESHHTYYLNKKKRYLNSGSCSLGRFQGIILDTETLRYEMIKEVKGSVKEVYEMKLAV